MVRFWTYYNTNVEIFKYKKNKHKLFFHLRQNSYSKEIFCYARNFFLTLEVRSRGFCYARKKVLRYRSVHLEPAPDEVKLDCMSCYSNRPCCSWQMNDVLVSHRLAKNTNCLLFWSYEMTAKRRQSLVRPRISPPAEQIQFTMMCSIAV